jgi:hypothetical protein
MEYTIMGEYNHSLTLGMPDFGSSLSEPASEIKEMVLVGIGQIIGKFSSGGENALPGILQTSAMELAQSREHGVGVFPRPSPSRATHARLHYIAISAFHCATV